MADNLIIFSSSRQIENEPFGRPIFVELGQKALGLNQSPKFGFEVPSCRCGQEGLKLTFADQPGPTLCLSVAVDCGAISHHPLQRLKRRNTSAVRPKKRLTHEEVNLFIHEAWRRNHPYFLRWLLPLITGMRRSEVAGLRWSDFDLIRGQIRLERQEIPKEGIVPNLKDKEARMPPIPKKFLPLFEKAKSMAKSDKVIEARDHEWKSGNQSKVTRAFCREIGVTEVTYHQLRASFITNGLLEGVSTSVMKEIVGHSRLSTTDGYFRASGADLLGKTDNLGVDIPVDDAKKKVINLRLVDDSLQNPS